MVPFSFYQNLCRLLSISFIYTLFNIYSRTPKKKRKIRPTHKLSLNIRGPYFFYYFYIIWDISVQRMEKSLQKCSKRVLFSLSVWYDRTERWWIWVENEHTSAGIYQNNRQTPEKVPFHTRPWVLFGKWTQFWVRLNRFEIFFVHRQNDGDDYLFCYPKDVNLNIPIILIQIMLYEQKSSTKLISN